MDCRIQPGKHSRLEPIYLLLIGASAPAFEPGKFGCGYESAFIPPAAE
jgi:hypothetical protein